MRPNNCWGKPSQAIYKTDDTLKFVPNPLKTLPHKQPDKMKTKKAVHKKEKPSPSRNNLRPYGYLGTNYTITKSQKEVPTDEYYGTYQYGYDDNDYEDHRQLTEFDFYVDMTTVTYEKHTIIRSDICDWLNCLIANNSPFAIVKANNGSLRYIKTHEKPPTEWTGTKVELYKFHNNVPSFKQFTQNIFVVFPFLLESDMFVSLLNKLDLLTFVCVCKTTNRLFSEYYRTRDWTKAASYNRFAYKITFEKNKWDSDLYFEKLPDNKFTVKESLMYSYTEDDCHHDDDGFCGNDGRRFPYLFITK
ncbi:hypothetical protein QKU48_gp1380 [Fadolivirus algeromassiliense]|jgi:hypothetical protein|uniref:F-box domain-containing protein n=1 Tax=Fadolivirus FV1/VV64 TaxID=3070911 RepID=A0A7D3R324_9VIRU|nr:hypothetical protein QKU48_gp1380 [Fadolivirus algeromassiliense]QKF94838.1 hypothetical protein Fadolivirus_1_1380 [Fadolivirus FV1/VV64]